MLILFLIELLGAQNLSTYTKFMIFSFPNLKVKWVILILNSQDIDMIFEFLDLELCFDLRKH